MNSTDRVPRSETGRWPWRYRCPEGHSSIDIHRTRIWCKSCGQSYPIEEMQDRATQQADTGSESQQ